MWDMSFARWVLACFALLLPAVTYGAGPSPSLHKRFVVVIDPGHGGSNHGCEGHHTHEKHITLALGLELATQLRRALPHADVRLTREDDRSLTLADRVAFANAAKADLFLSLHANASGGKLQSGYETWVVDMEAGDLEAARTSSRENDEGFGSIAPADDASRMLRELTLGANRRFAMHLAQAIQREQAQRFPKRVDRGVRQGPFDVLLGVRMPAVLFEAGFLDHPVEGAALRDPKTRETIVDGVTDAVVAYYRGIVLAH